MTRIQRKCAQTAISTQSIHSTECVDQWAEHEHGHPTKSMPEVASERSAPFATDTSKVAGPERDFCCDPGERDRDKTKQESDFGRTGISCLSIKISSSNMHPCCFTEASEENWHCLIYVYDTI